MKRTDFELADSSDGRKIVTVSVGAWCNRTCRSIFGRLEHRVQAILRESVVRIVYDNLGDLVCWRGGCRADDELARHRVDRHSGPVLNARGDGRREGYSAAEVPWARQRYGR